MQVESGHGRSFGSTKRQSQGLPRHCIEPDLEMQNPTSRLDTQQATLARMNERLEKYHRKWQYTLKPGNSRRSAEFDDHLHRALHFPQWPHDLVEVCNAEWMQRASLSYSLQTPAPAKRLKVEVDLGWCVVVSNHWWLAEMPVKKRMDRTVGDTPIPDSQVFYWVDDLLWFKSTVRALPFQFELLFGSIIETTELDDFLCERTPVTGDVAHRLYRVLSGKDRKGLVLFPDSAQAFEDAVNMLGHGGDERCCSELVGGDIEFPFRIFVLDDDSRLNILAIPRDSKANVVSLPSLLHQTLGEIDVGAPGFAAINYWLEHLIPGGPVKHSLILLDMVKSMLETIPLWVEADRTADNR